MPLFTYHLLAYWPIYYHIFLQIQTGDKQATQVLCMASSCLRTSLRSGTESASPWQVPALDRSARTH